jgi:hypothetical protein
MPLPFPVITRAFIGLPVAIADGEFSAHDLT